MEIESNLLNEIKTIVNKARYNAFRALNREMLKAYFEIGKKIVEEEQNGKKRAEYGKKLIEKLSKELTKEFKKGFDITINNEHYYIDLLFYNIFLKCYVIIELKIGKFKNEDVGQINFYLNYIKKEINSKDDNEPIGIILCTEKNNVQVEYALSGITNKMFVSKYRLYLPKKEKLEKEIKKLL